MKLLAVIPARGGSVGVPRKNVRNLCGKPLIAYTIEAARQACSIEKFVVSTEDEAIAEAARSLGATVPFLRPQAIATDNTPAIDVALHALSKMPSFDWLLLLQPTSPLRTAADIEGIVQLCRERGASSAVSVCETAQHPQWMYRCDSVQRLVPFSDVTPSARRQDLPPVYALNGALYLARADWLQRERSFIGSDTLAYIMPAERSVDIDTPLDWEWAEFLLERNRD
jgi:CMP-N,N'-diacetyllegionaminic acid synthase